MKNKNNNEIIINEELAGQMTTADKEQFNSLFNSAWSESPKMAVDTVLAAFSIAKTTIETMSGDQERFDALCDKAEEELASISLTENTTEETKIRVAELSYKVIEQARGAYDKTLEAKKEMVKTAAGAGVAASVIISFPLLICAIAKLFGPSSRD